MRAPVDHHFASDRIMRVSATKLLSAALMSGVLMIVVGLIDLTSGAEDGARHRAHGAAATGLGAP